jgi:hypothetical protein
MAKRRKRRKTKRQTFDEIMTYLNENTSTLPLDQVEYLTEEIAKIATEAKGLAFQEVIKSTRLKNMKFSINTAPDDFTVQWARDYTGKLITNLTETSKRGIAEYIATGIHNSKKVKTVTAEIRRLLESAPNGLTQQQARKLARIRQEAIDQGKTDAQVARIVFQERKRMYQQRAETIARTEMARALSEGKRAQALRMGASRKRSISKRDNRVSELCRFIERQRWIPIDQDYPEFDGVSSSGVPNHINCRCREVFRTPKTTQKALEAIYGL